MTETYLSSRLDERLSAVAAMLAELGATTRGLSVAVPRGGPVPVDHFPALFQTLAVNVSMPAEFRLPGWSELDALTDAEKRVVLAFGGGYADPSGTLSLPGASLSGFAMEALGTREQQESYFRQWSADPQTRSFFGLTEPNAGTNASELECHLDPAQLSLTGTKRWIGDVVHADTGVLFVRTAPGPFGITCVRLDLPAPGATARLLPLVGMRTSGLGELALDRVGVKPEHLLGQHLSASRRGLWGMRQVFLRMRMTVAGLALGAGAALIEESRDELRGDLVLDDLAAEGRALVTMLWRAADQPAEERSSLCKVAGVAWASKVALHVGGKLSPFPPKSIIGKLIRDIIGMEFMEGTAPKQRQIIVDAWLRQGTVM